MYGVVASYLTFHQNLKLNGDVRTVFDVRNL